MNSSPENNLHLLHVGHLQSAQIYLASQSNSINTFSPPERFLGKKSKVENQSADESAVHVLLSSFYPDFIQILYRFYIGFISILS